jgi:hypothetical protein
MTRPIGFVGLGIAALLAAGTALGAPVQPEPQTGPPGWGPPGAWMETRGGDRWLQTGEYMWCHGPGDPGPPVGVLRPGGYYCALTPQAALVFGAACRIALAGPPEIRLAPGETARLHLSFTPASLALARGSEVLALAPAATADLPPATATGGMVVAAGDGLGSRVRYRARIVVTTDTARAAISGVRARREGGRAVLSLSLSEPARVEGCIAPVLNRGESNVAKARSLFRPLRAGQRAAGENAIALGALPARRYRLYLRARDRDGNSTHVSRLITIPLVVR